MPPPPPRRLYPAPAAYTQQAAESLRPRPLKVTLIVLGAIVALAVLATAGIVLFRSGSQASALAAELHGHMQRQEWDTIYADASPAWKQRVSLDQTRSLFARLHDKLGAPVSSSQLSFNANTDTTGRYLIAIYKTTYTLNATGTETIRWQLIDGKYRLLYYHVTSPQLPAATPLPAVQP